MVQIIPGGGCQGEDQNDTEQVNRIRPRAPDGPYQSTDRYDNKQKRNELDLRISHRRNIVLRPL